MHFLDERYLLHLKKFFWILIALYKHEKLQHAVTTASLHSVPQWDNQAGARFRTTVPKSGGFR